MQVLYEREPTARIVLLDSADEVSSLISIFEQIAFEQAWNIGDQLHAYPASSTYFGLLSNDELVGGLQLVQGNRTEGLPCLTVWPELDLQGRTDVADIALLALDPSHRGRKYSFWLLCIEMWRHCQRLGIESLWMEVTPTNLNLYRRLGWPLQIAGPLRCHWGEECYPCWMTIEAVGQEMARRAPLGGRYLNIYQLLHRSEQP